MPVCSAEGTIASPRIHTPVITFGMLRRQDVNDGGPTESEPAYLQVCPTPLAASASASDTELLKLPLLLRYNNVSHRLRQFSYLTADSANKCVCDLLGTLLARQMFCNSK